LAAGSGAVAFAFAPAATLGRELKFCDAAGSGVEYGALIARLPAIADGHSFLSSHSGAYCGFRILVIVFIVQRLEYYGENCRTAKKYDP
jgi:hypothetical protein